MERQHSAMENPTAQNAPLERLRVAMTEHLALLKPYEQRSEPVTFETLRALDDLFCRDLMEPKKRSKSDESQSRSVAGWGVNAALSRVLPVNLADAPFKLFPSTATTQHQADDFLEKCGCLELAARYEGWLRDGLVSGKLRAFPGMSTSGITDVLVLRTEASSHYDEEIGRKSLRWASNQVVKGTRIEETCLENEYRILKPLLQEKVFLSASGMMNYSSSPAIDKHFAEWARIYLKRIYSQDMIDSNDVIGGRKFSDYLAVLSALSARSQRHISYAAILKARHPDIHIRNLLTSFCEHGEMVRYVAAATGFSPEDSAEILDHFTLSQANIAEHLKRGETIWAPLVRTSRKHLIVPIYGIDINPFLFLLTELRHRHEKDWFRIANNREPRWISELSSLFGGRRWSVNDRNLRLRSDGRDRTDIDFAVFDSSANELTLFQLKWQHPVGVDNRGRRNAGSNLTIESNRWIEEVIQWTEQHGLPELMRRLGFSSTSQPVVRLFVMARYHAHFSGYDNRDPRAVWVNWAQFQKARAEAPGQPLRQTAAQLRRNLKTDRSKIRPESRMLGVGTLGIVLNPTATPEDTTL